MPSDDSSAERRAIRKPSLIFRFIKCLIIAVAVVAGTIAAVVYFNVYLPQGTGPAGPDVPLEPFKHVWSNRKVMLLGIGDSITAGYGAREGFSYFDRLVKNPAPDSRSPRGEAEGPARLAEDDESRRASRGGGDSPDMPGKNLSTVFPNLETQNLAVSGSTSFEHYEVIKSLQSRPNDVFVIVVMTTGGNDLIHNYGQRPPEEGAMYGASYTQAKPWIDNFELRLDEMLTHLHKIFPGGCQIFLANIYDPTDGTGNTSAWLTGLPAWPDAERILLAYNATLSKFADKYKYVHLVDIHKPFLGHGIHCRKFWIKHYHRDDPTYWFYLNIEDPSERGYDAIRRLFLNEMVKVFAGEKGS